MDIEFISEVENSNISMIKRNIIALFNIKININMFHIAYYLIHFVFHLHFNTVPLI